MICEKPLFFTTEEVREVKALAESKGLIVGVTYGFSGHPLLLQMRAMVDERRDRRRARGRPAIHPRLQRHRRRRQGRATRRSGGSIPKVAGPTFVLGDISTHTYYMSQLVMPRMRIRELLCDRQSFIPSRAPLEDNAFVLMRYENGAVGRLWASSINAGCMDSQRIRIVGSKASLVWTDVQPERAAPTRCRASRTGSLYHGMPYLDAELQRRRAARRAPHRGPDQVLGQHLPQVRHRHRREEPRRRGDAGRARLPRHRRRPRGRALARELRALGRQGSVWVPFE